jgi:hypothetical protein
MTSSPDTRPPCPFKPGDWVVQNYEGGDGLAYQVTAVTVWHDEDPELTMKFGWVSGWIVWYGPRGRTNNDVHPDLRLAPTEEVVAAQLDQVGGL